MNFKISFIFLNNGTKFHYDHMKFLKGNIWSSRPLCNFSVSCKKMVFSMQLFVVWSEWLDNWQTCLSTSNTSRSMAKQKKKLANISPSDTAPFYKNETGRVFYRRNQKM